MGLTTFTNLDFFNKNSTFKMGKLIFLVFFSFLSSTSIMNAQDKERIEMFSFEQLSQNSTTKSVLPNYLKPENIIPLITELKPSIKMEGGVFTIQGEKPVKAYLDIRSLKSPIPRNVVFDNVELVVINIENQSDLFSQINLDNLSGFTKLKYIQIVCRVDCNQNQISNALISSLKNYVIIYSVEKQS
ncbi:MAG: hypothetical protein NXH73_10235 [Flavobacteriaceae bacterium]|nr:hypothetical protein [Flavobacteriaceae bacterium]